MSDFPIRGELNAAGSSPLYEQLISIIRQNVREGRLSPGDPLPSESEFCEHYGISRSTVRAALAELEEEGLVVRHQGKGSFVSRPRIVRSLHNLYSFTDEITAMGLVPHSRVLAYEVITPGEEIKRHLGLVDPEEKVFSITRIRYAGDEPLALEMAFIPRRICPFLTQAMMEEGSLYNALIREAGIRLGHAQETYEAMLLGENEAALLGVPKDSSAFFVQRVSYTDSDDVFEYTVMIVRGDRCRYEVDLTAENVQLSRRMD
jgi:GntR family transcriptional regulator